MEDLCRNFWDIASYVTLAIHSKYVNISFIHLLTPCVKTVRSVHVSKTSDVCNDGYLLRNVKTSCDRRWDFPNRGRSIIVNTVGNHKQTQGIYIWVADSRRTQREKFTLETST